VIAQLDLGSAGRVTFELSTGPIAALQAGPVGAPIVRLVPGYTGSKEDFAALLGPLADAGFQVTAIDLPGQYESPGPIDAAAYTSDALGRTVLELAAVLGPSVHLLGHSFGGLVTRAAVIARPSAFADLVLLGSGPDAIAGERRARLEQLAPVYAEQGAAAVYSAIAAADSAVPGYTAPPPELAHFLEHRFLSGAPAMLPGMAAALQAEPDRVAELAGTGVSCLVVHGVDDASWPPRVQAEMARRLGADYVVIDGAAHSPAVENPAGTAEALLQFWGNRR